MQNFSDLVQRVQLHGNYVIHSSAYLNQYIFILYTATKIRYKWPYLPELIDSRVWDNLGARLLVKSTSQVDLKRLVMKPTAPENFDGDVATDRLDPTWKAQVDLIDPICRTRVPKFGDQQGS